MKKKISILIAAAFALTSCGTMSLTSSSGQRFSDGLYSAPRVEDRQKSIAAKTETDELVQKTRDSEIYLSSSDTGSPRTDTLYIPENKSAIINFSNAGTSVTITDDPFDQVYLSIYPWTYYRPLTFRSMYWDPWYYGRYWGYYDPWYWDRWGYRDPWFWGFGYALDPWFYDPWYWGPAYRPWYHHYCGWYGGWGPGLGWAWRSWKGCLFRAQRSDRIARHRFIFTAEEFLHVRSKERGRDTHSGKQARFQHEFFDSEEDIVGNRH